MTLNKINKLAIIALAPFLYLASTGVSATPIEILNDTSFESAVSSQGSQTSWTSSAYGSWGVGDPLSTVSSAPGISPLTGNKMLQFGTTGGSSSDIYQIVDVSGYATEIDAGLASVDLSIFFNAGSANSSMGLRLGGWTAAPTNFGGFTLLGGGFNNISIGGDGWEEFTVDDIQLTTGIRYLAFGIHEPTALPLAYADDASLKLTITSVPAPSSLVLMGLGLIGLSMIRRNHIGPG